MKPLELRIYERHPYADAYKFGPSYTPTCLAVTEKRFSDGELAAEAYRAMWSGELAKRVYGEPSEENKAKIATMLRFATLPHFDSEES